MEKKAVVRVNLHHPELTIQSEVWMRLKHSLLNSLANGDIVVVPTETSYMLAADATSPDAVAKVFSKKNRPHSLRISVAFGTIAQTEKWVIWNSTARKIADGFLPGPLTIILSKKKPNQYLAGIGDRDIAIRIPDQPFLRDLMVTYGKPLTATSANTHGSEEPYNITDCVMDADFYWDAGQLEGKQPSTVIKIQDNQFKVIRAGGILESEIRKIIAV